VTSDPQIPEAPSKDWRHRRRTAAWASLALLASVAAGGCGRSRSLSPSPMCAVATTRTPPFPTTIELRNDGATTVYLSQGCIGLDYGISSCAGGYRDAVGPAYHCACSCAEASCRGPVLCGPCAPPSAAAVAPGEHQDILWDALRVADVDRGTYQCVTSEALPAARYRLAIDVYDTQDGATARAAGRLVTVDFVLPATDDRVVVDLAGPEDLCDDDPTAPAPACAETASREVPCDLAAGVNWFANGGLALFSDWSALAPPSTFTRVRTFYGPQATPASTATCMADVPRCSRDARVVTTADVTAALAHPDVKAALQVPGQLVYGLDSRPSDGAVLVVEAGAGSFAVGGPCQPGTTDFCARALPPGLAALARSLTGLDEQQMRAPACAALPTSAP